MSMLAVQYEYSYCSHCVRQQPVVCQLSLYVRYSTASKQVEATVLYS